MPTYKALPPDDRDAEESEVPVTIPADNWADAIKWTEMNRPGWEVWCRVQVATDEEPNKVH